MLNISLVAIGNKMPAWVNQGFHEYANRLHGNTRLQLIEVPAIKRGKNADLNRILVQEGKSLQDAAPKEAKIITLDRLGKSHSTLQIKNKMDDWLLDSRPISFLVGGPEGIDPTVIKASDEQWSLSAMTFSHPIVRIILAEQIYRAWSITQGLPYHR